MSCHQRQEMPITPEQHDRLLELILHPPPGGKIEAAKLFGIDLTLNLQTLLMTPEERVRNMEAFVEFLQEARRAKAIEK